MKRVLRRLDFINQDTILAKGQAACLISTSDEILLTEMLYNGSFNDIEPNMLCSIFSCFLVSEQSKGELNPKDKKDDQLFKNLFNKVKENASRVADVLIECKINIDKVTTINNSS